MFAFARAPAPLSALMSKTRALSALSGARIEDNSDESVFQLKMNSDYGRVEYSRTGDVYDLHHSHVPDQYKGRGYGHILAKKTFDYIAEHGLKMRISCDFLQKVYEEHEAKYKKYLA